MTLVLDCSLVGAWCFDDEAGPKTDAILAKVVEEGAIVPSLWRWEVANLLALAERKGRLPADRRVSFLAQLSLMPIKIDEEAADHAWAATSALARQHKLTAYDAAYLELALRVRGDLATLDDDLRKAARKSGVTLLPG